jgi:NAD(P)-dependent dehydrogenase (short-subunit alcohol dehydrogenase family)
MALDAQFGRLDALVHTAVQLGSLGPIEHQSFDRWLAVLRVDLAAPMGLTRALVPLLAKSFDGSVVFTLDTRGEDPRAYWGSYAAAKAGLSALARILADEWEKRDNLRVNAVVPGPMRSPLRTQTHPAEDVSALPAPEALVPLYLHLVNGQAKAESARRIDAQAWLAGAPAESSLLP